MPGLPLQSRESRCFQTGRLSFFFFRLVAYTEVKRIAKRKSMELRWGYLIAYIVAVPLYVGITLAAPHAETASRYHLSTTAILLLQLTIIIPVILIWLAGLFMMWRGSRALLAAQPKRPSFGLRYAIFSALILVIGLVLGVMIFQNEARNFSPEPSRIASYYLSDPLILLTILLPSLAAWIFGGLAAVNIRGYGQSIRTPRTRKAFLRLASGLTAIITLYVTLQAFGAASVALAKLSLGSLLGIVYLILTIYGFGYLFLAWAAQSLVSLSPPRPAKPSRSSPTGLAD